MQFADLLERYDSFYDPTFELDVDGESVTEADGVVSGLQVELALDRTNRFSFTLTDVFDLRTREFTALAERFEEGATVDVTVGYGTETTHVLRGAIDSARPTFPADGGPTVAVSGHDLLHGLTKGTGTGNWTDATLQSVVEDLVGDVDFADTDVAGSDVSFERLAHPETSDFAFLQQLADEYGFELFSSGGVLSFREPTRDASPALTLEYGRALRSFSPSDARGSPDVGTVKFRHYDEKAGEKIVAEADVPGGGDETEVHTVPVRSGEEAERRATAKADRHGRGGGNRGETVGIPELQVGSVVELTGLGEAHSGAYYVESVSHQVGSSGFSTSFEVTEVSE